MPFTQALQSAQPFWDQQYYWPDPAGQFTIGDPSARMLFGNAQTYMVGPDTGNPSVTQSRQLWGANVTGAGGTATLRRNAGLVCYQADAVAVAGSAAFIPGIGMRYVGFKTRAADWAPGSGSPSRNRVYWLSVLLRGTGVGDDGTGFLMMPYSTATGSVRWPTQPVGILNTGGWGLVGDGAGQWRWRSYGDTAAPDVLETVALAAHTYDDWNLMELIYINSGPSREATVELRFNGASVLTRNWTGAGPGVSPIDLAVGDAGLIPSFRALDNAGAASQISIAGLHVRLGRFTPLGLELAN